MFGDFAVSGNLSLFNTAHSHFVFAIALLLFLIYVNTLFLNKRTACK